MEKIEDDIPETPAKPPKPIIVIMRLITGEDVIGEIFDIQIGMSGTRMYTIANPMTIEFIEQRNGRQALQLHTWMSLLLVKKSLFEMYDKDIITMVEPSDDFLKYYNTTIEEMLKLLKEAKEKSKLAKEAGADSLFDDGNVVPFKSNTKTILH